MENEIYTGWKKWYPTDAELADFYTTHICPLELKENEYLIVMDKNDDRDIEIVKMQDGRLVKINHASFKSKSESGKIKAITPRNPEQKCAFDLLTDDRSTVKLITGKWGCG